MEDLHTDNTNYIDTPFTLELKGYIKELEEKLVLVIQLFLDILCRFL